MILLEELKKIQKRFGYLKESEIIKLSKKVSIPLAKIYGTASFYSFLETRKRGLHIIRVCNNLPCMAKGSEKIIKHLEKTLKISAGETTKDGKITLETTSCIGCCNNAPALMVDGMLYTNLDEKKADAIIKKLKK